jgi:hypothetical protein
MRLTAPPPRHQPPSRIDPPPPRFDAPARVDAPARCEQIGQRLQTIERVAAQRDRHEIR